MPGRESPIQSETPQGTLDMLVLRVLVMGAAHGHTIAHAIERGSQDVLQIEHGSLYPALHRLENRRWIASFWGTSENNRRAKYYRLTPAGRKQLAAQTRRALVHPVFFGSAITGAGVDALISGVTELLPALAVLLLPRELAGELFESP